MEMKARIVRQTVTKPLYWRTDRGWYDAFKRIGGGFMMNGPKTATQTASHDGLSKLDLERIRRQLAAMRAELLSRAGDRIRLQLKQVDDAMRKLTAGAYGHCESCARPMVKDRLFAMPSVRYCTACSGGPEKKHPTFPPHAS
jgi:RNA polymerase-binding transcription factor DksA